MFFDWWCNWSRETVSDLSALIRTTWSIDITRGFFKSFVKIELQTSQLRIEIQCDRPTQKGTNCKVNIKKSYAMKSLVQITCYTSRWKTRWLLHSSIVRYMLLSDMSCIWYSPLMLIISYFLNGVGFAEWPSQSPVQKSNWIYGKS